MRNKVQVYTDGACSGNPGPGGYAAVIIADKNEVQELCGGAQQTTNNRMEIMGAISALEYLAPGPEIEIYTDSRYLRDGITLWINKWRTNSWVSSRNEPVKNIDLWQQLDELVNRHKGKIKWVWVKGHAGDPQNERADSLARQALIAAVMKKTS